MKSNSNPSDVVIPNPALQDALDVMKGVEPGQSALDIVTEPAPPLKAPAPKKSAPKAAPAIQPPPVVQDHPQDIPQQRFDYGEFQSTEALVALFKESLSVAPPPDPSVYFRLYQTSAAKAPAFGDYPDMIKVTLKARIHDLIRDDTFIAKWCRLASHASIPWSMSRIQAFLCGKAGEVALQEVVDALHLEASKKPK